ncbi:hypothetical protein KM043_002256 [Ampulex compressa]|nr:hypothetical protein KM043_002256 [Ampulex compressa]
MDILIRRVQSSALINNTACSANIYQLITHSAPFINRFWRIEPGLCRAPEESSEEWNSSSGERRRYGTVLREIEADGSRVAGRPGSLVKVSESDSSQLAPPDSIPVSFTTARSRLPFQFRPSTSWRTDGGRELDNFRRQRQSAG